MTVRSPLVLDSSGLPSELPAADSITSFKYTPADFAALIALVGMAQGDRAYVAGFGAAGGSEWYYSGTKWLLSSTLELRLTGSVAAPLGNAITGVTVATIFTGVTWPKIPASLLAIGSHIEIRTLIKKTGAGGTWSVRTYLGTAGTTSDTALGGPAGPITTGVSVLQYMQIWASGSNIVTGTGALAPNNSGATVADSGTNINFAADMFLSVGVLPVSGSDSFALIDYRVLISP